VKILKKAAIICVMVLMVSIIPAFALNDTNSTNGTQTQNQTQQTNQTQTKNTTGTINKNCYKDCSNDGTCDGDQHKYQYGKNGNADAKNGNCNGDQYKYQYGKKNNANTNCGKNPNCLKS
jgi:hypothetical protein